MSLDTVQFAFLPYCIQKQRDGRYMVLNREYKPVGFWTREWVDYTSGPFLVKIKGLTKRTVASISFNGDTSLDRIYLYNDGCIPTRSAKHMTAYLKRLGRIAKYKIGYPTSGRA
jgi:hypothetical protein